MGQEFGVDGEKKGIVLGRLGLTQDGTEEVNPGSPPTAENTLQCDVVWRGSMKAHPVERGDSAGFRAAKTAMQRDVRLLFMLLDR